MSKYAIFDIDGTLNQTALYALEAYQRALKKRGRRAEEAEIISCIGLSPAGIIEKLFVSLSGEELADWRKDIKDYEFQLMEEHAAAFPGVKESLDKLLEAGYQLAICSNAFPEHIEHVLEMIHLKDYFPVIGSLNMGSSKAEVLGTLLKQLGCEAACLVGDRKFDIDAARQNQIPVVGCAYGYAPEEIQSADRVIGHGGEIAEAVMALI
ncbi:HAD family hydrolase [Faecalicatena sp. AGMB00832]|uniref:HAD family hydrolase n=1 Tax=Faecalicatena faecalis TaxID=2726362 RepID=A0ABS6CZM0_9FIRM|nr:MULTISPECIES: HAD-IA family hydrolase [Faecalicatena]MBU3874570.1 HAD family hydrolase [Faecalicatena faecalis]MCI6464767.1 HAD family hydrolase [Faecalicatena sp.]MDY5621069.1 HAD-IA family hydrolase [Lachnospiraceae bacterium]